MHPLDKFLKKRDYDRATLAKKANVAHSTLTSVVNRSTSVYDMRIWVLVTLIDLIQGDEPDANMDSVLQELSLYEAQYGFDEALKELKEKGGYIDDGITE
ncbi:hypothetical protein HCA69_12550 [Listeria grandensis]|uniref:Uncharacterized protein n=1 Tax=Listeria grandensis TaxID=1494963 RepID=A0A7X0Y5M0_9LIST|nr:hypothetical protein [Listeria grandensis]MBC1937203.1 hypothetical protein [Listeria grandensis]